MSTATPIQELIKGPRLLREPAQRAKDGRLVHPTQALHLPAQPAGEPLGLLEPLDSTLEHLTLFGARSLDGTFQLDSGRGVTCERLLDDTRQADESCGSRDTNAEELGSLFGDQRRAILCPSLQDAHVGPRSLLSLERVIGVVSELDGL